MNKIITNRWVHLSILLIMLAGFVVTSYSDARWRKKIRDTTFDNYNILKPYETGDDVVIINIDEASLAHPDLGQWPWSRTKLAGLVEKLDEMGARVIAFDMVFSEPDRTSPHYVLDLLDKDSDEGKILQKKLKTIPNNDEVFAQAIKDASNVVTGFSATGEATVRAPKLITHFTGPHVGKYVTKQDGMAINLRDITRDAAGNGSFFISTDTDGILRRAPMLVGHEKHDGSIIDFYPSLSLEAFRVFKGFDGLNIVPADKNSYESADVSALGIGGISFRKNSKRAAIPTNERGEFLVYFAQHRKEWYVSALDIIQGTAAPSRIKNKIALIGTDAIGLKDIRSTPLSPFRPGVEIHLNVIDQIIQKKFLLRPAAAKLAEAFYILLGGLSIIFLAPFIGAAAQVVIVSMALTATVLGGWFAFIEYGFLIDVTFSSLSIFALFVVSSTLNYIRTEADRKHVKDAFGLYISPDYMKELTSGTGALKLGGETRELTTMFTDIRNFTSISERLTPEELIELMNKFLTPISDIVMKHRGTIDKYMGDAMMAFWNAPLDDDKHAENACRAALRMNKALKPLNKVLKAKAEKQGLEPLLLKAGIGINTGPASVGNMGSKQRFAYSALGDSVNLASRLEGQTKSYGISIMIGENTQAAIPHFATLELDLLRVKGKKEPVRVYSLLGTEKYAAKAFFAPWKEQHDLMFSRYRQQDFEGALGHLQKARELAGRRFVYFYRMYEHRIRNMMQDPPGSDWDGVYIATSK